jgi:hypothetical protein
VPHSSSELDDFFFVDEFALARTELDRFLFFTGGVVYFVELMFSSVGCRLCMVALKKSSSSGRSV